MILRRKPGLFMNAGRLHNCNKVLAVRRAARKVKRKIPENLNSKFSKLAATASRRIPAPQNIKRLAQSMEGSGRVQVEGIPIGNGPIWVVCLGSGAKIHLRHITSHSLVDDQPPVPLKFSSSFISLLGNPHPALSQPCTKSIGTSAYTYFLTTQGRIGTN